MVDKKQDFGIASYVLGIMSIVLGIFNPLAGVVFGFIGISLSKKQKNELSTKSRKLNIIGIIVGLVVLIATVVAAIWGAIPTESLLPTN